MFCGFTISDGHLKWTSQPWGLPITPLEPALVLLVIKLNDHPGDKMGWKKLRMIDWPQQSWEQPILQSVSYWDWAGMFPAIHITDEYYFCSLSHMSHVFLKGYIIKISKEYVICFSLPSARQLLWHAAPTRPVLQKYLRTLVWSVQCTEL